MGSWSILKQSIVHFIVMLFTVLPILIMSGWFVLKSSLDYVKLIGIFIFVGFVLWLFFYILFTNIIKG
ncbi:DUF3021 family protein [Ignavigranum ruoffiae]|uniref:DUF3021 family protein n=1 Tax=Ignavigranum ruoffiae TaxID=89093 RepID=UPI00205451D0|nr:DUF3021 family protein [Ignavigranum ruoffiae]UPQ86678.1 DUF3021 family protein [Ignavigranum ruoffiae]